MHSGSVSTSSTAGAIASESSSSLLSTSTPAASSSALPAASPSALPAPSPSAPSVASYSAPSVASYSAPSVASHSAPSVASYSAPSVASYSAPSVASYSAPSVASHSAALPAASASVVPPGPAAASPSPSSSPAGSAGAPRFGTLRKIWENISENYQKAYDWITDPINNYSTYKQKSAEYYEGIKHNYNEIIYYGLSQFCRYPAAGIAILLKKSIQLALFLTVSPFLLYVLLPLKVTNDKAFRLFISFILGPLTLLALPFITSAIALIAMVPVIGPIMAILIGIQFSIFTGSNIMNAMGLPSWFGQTATNFLSSSITWLQNNPVTSFFSSLSSFSLSRMDAPFLSANWFLYYIIKGTAYLPGLLLPKPNNTSTSEIVSGKGIFAGFYTFFVTFFVDRPLGLYVTNDTLVSSGFWSTVVNYAYAGIRSMMAFICADKINDYFGWVKHETPFKEGAQATGSDSSDAKPGEVKGATPAASGTADIGAGIGGLNTSLTGRRTVLRVYDSVDSDWQGEEATIDLSNIQAARRQAAVANFKLVQNIGVDAEEYILVKSSTKPLLPASTPASARTASRLPSLAEASVLHPAPKAEAETKAVPAPAKTPTTVAATIPAPAPR